MALEKIGVEAVIEGLSSFRRGIGQMNDDVQGFGGTANGIIPSLNSMGDSLLKIGGIAAGAALAGVTALAGGLAVFAKEGIQGAIDLESQMSGIAAVLGKTKSEVEPLKNLITSLGLDPNLQISSEGAAAAIEMLARNGLDMTQILDGAAKATVLLANATGGDLSKSADIATDVLAQFNLETNQLVDVADSITGVVNNSKLSLDSFGLALANAGGVAAVSGVEFEDFTTTIAAISPLFSSGADAGTSFKTFLQRLIPVSGNAAGAMMELGLLSGDGLTNAFFTASGEMKSMAEISQILNDATKDLTEEQKSNYLSTIFGTDAIRAAAGIANLTADEFEALSDKINEETSAADNAATRTDNLKGRVEVLKDSISALGVSMFGGAIDPLREFVDTIISAVEPIGKFVERIQQGFPPMAAFRSMIFNMAEAFGYTDEEAGGIAGTAVELIKRFQEFGLAVQDIATRVGNFVVENAEPLKGALLGISAVLGAGVIVSVLTIVGGLLAALVSPIGLLIIGAAALGAAWQSNFLNIQQLTEGVWSAVQTGFSAFKSLFEGDWAGFLSTISIAWEIAWAAITEFMGNIWTMVQPYLVAFWESTVAWFDSVDWLALGQKIVNGVFEGAAMLGELVGTWVAYLVESLTTFVNDADWSPIGYNIITFIGDAIVAAVAGAAFIIATVYEYYKEFFATQDWKQIGLDLMNAIIGALSEFGTGVAPVLQEWWNTFSNWVASADWGSLGTSIVDTVILGLVTFTVNVNSMLTDWYNSFVEWANNADWESIGESLVYAIIDTFTVFDDEVPSVLVEWYNTFVNWVSEQDWEAIAIGIVQGIVYFLSGQWAADIIDIVKQWFTRTDDEVGKIKWKDIGAGIVAGITRGLTEKAGDLAAAAAQMALNAWQAAKSALGIESPSKMFAEIGRSIVEGMIVGVEDEEATLYDKLKSVAGSLTGTFNGLVTGIKNFSLKPMETEIERLEKLSQGAASGANRLYEQLILKPEDLQNLRDQRSKIANLQDQIEKYKNLQLGASLTDAERQIVIKKLTADLKDDVTAMEALKNSLDFKAFDELTRQEQISQYFAALQSGNTQLAQAIKHAWDMQRELNGATAEYEDQQAAIAKLQEKQQQFAFLQSQLDLINQLTEAGLDPNQILAGISLGLDASQEDLLAAMTATIEALIAQAESALEISSPSKVFTRFGEFISGGLAQGIIANAVAPAMAMESMLSNIVQPAQAIAAQPMVANQQSVTNINRSASVQFGDVSVSNDMDMQMLGDFVLQKVSEAI